MAETAPNKSQSIKSRPTGVALSGTISLAEREVALLVEKERIASTFEKTERDGCGEGGDGDNREG